MGGDGRWLRPPEGVWTDIDQLVVPAGLPSADRRQAQVEPPKVQATLRLGRAARTEASLFVLEHGLAQVEQLVRSTPEQQLENILFVVTEYTVVLRACDPAARPTPERCPEWPTRGRWRCRICSPLVGQTIEPPLRRDRLRTWLAPDPDLVTWLQPLERADPGVRRFHAPRCSRLHFGR